MTMSFTVLPTVDPKRIAQPGCKRRTKGVASLKFASRLRSVLADARRGVGSVTRLVQSVP
jgi:hypothetical protein